MSFSSFFRDAAIVAAGACNEADRILKQRQIDKDLENALRHTESTAGRVGLGLLGVAAKVATDYTARKRHDDLMSRI